MDFQKEINHLSFFHFVLYLSYLNFHLCFRFSYFAYYLQTPFSHILLLSFHTFSPPLPFLLLLFQDFCIFFFLLINIFIILAHLSFPFYSNFCFPSISQKNILSLLNQVCAYSQYHLLFALFFTLLLLYLFLSFQDYQHLVSFHIYLH